MTRTIQLHPPSLLVGIGFALLGLVAMSQTSVGSKPQSQHAAANALVAHPRDWVVIREGSPYAVPTGMTLVVTALGVACPHGALNTFSATLSVDGAFELRADLYPDASVLPLSCGFSVESGHAVAVQSGASSLPVEGRAWGYLVPNNGAGYERLKVPGPSEWVIIKEGSGYVVPPGKILVLSAAGSTSGVGNISIGGVVEHSSGQNPLASFLSIPGLPAGLKAASGELVEVVTPTGSGVNARAWGYLVDA